MNSLSFLACRQKSLQALLAIAPLLASLTANAHPVAVNGSPSDWTRSPPPKPNMGHIARSTNLEGEFLWSDLAKDERTDFASPDESVDILEFRVTADVTAVYFLIKLNPFPLQPGPGAPLFQIAVDTSKATGLSGGSINFRGYSDTQVAPSAAWERLIQTTLGANGNAPLIWSDDSTLTPNASSSKQATSASANSYVELSVPWADLGISDPLALKGPLTFTVASFRTGTDSNFWDTADIGGSSISNALDVISHYNAPGSTPNTWTEVVDGVVDYNFDIWFHLDPDADPSSPLIISEFVSNAVLDPDGEFVELFNASKGDLQLETFRLGDAVDPGSNVEGMLQFPPGSKVTQDRVTVVANKASAFQTNYGNKVPDFELYNSNSVPDMGGCLWASGPINFANATDQILVLDRAYTVIDVAAWGNNQPRGYPSVDEHTPVTTPGAALARVPVRTDTDICPSDFAERSPTPGFPDPMCIGVTSGTPCDDGNLCTVGDVCNSQFVCVPGAQALLCDDINGCTTDGCVPATGCSFTPNQNPCDDNNACTVSDICKGGSCVGAGYSCNDNNACTTDVCNGDGSCKFTNNTSVCNDNNACTLADVCNNGLCSGMPTNCSDGNPCTTDSCNVVTGCVYSPNSSACDDKNACTIADKCVEGTCSGTTVSCSDNSICTDDACEPATGCTFTYNASVCNDLNACTDQDKCSYGACVGTSISCDDLNFCTTDTCDKQFGCINSSNTLACNDNNACTSGEICSNAACSGGGPTDCDDKNLCTDDSCDQALGCQHVNNTIACDDGDACSDGDSCSGGKCAGAVYSCDDNNSCTTDVCTGAGACTHDDNQLSCDDKNACTKGDICSASACFGTAYSCDDNNPCTDDACGGDGSCLHNHNTVTCDDNDPCSKNDLCSKGSCHGSGTCIDAAPDVDAAADSDAPIDVAHEPDVQADTAKADTGWSNDSTIADTGEHFDEAPASNHNTDKSSCSCKVPGNPARNGNAGYAVLALLALSTFRRRRKLAADRPAAKMNNSPASPSRA